MNEFISIADKGDIILDHITRVQIPGVIQFDARTGDSVANRYDLLNYRRSGTGSGGPCSGHCYTNVSFFINIWLSATFTFSSSGKRILKLLYGTFGVIKIFLTRANLCH